ncbi:hypothetical protein CYG49_02965 [Candidatus Saccharibacteria bacterium]|nr:MAG: hypothetical protein CYG49_02965 [Candidatus Saccharibacteria bacterium]
MSLLAPSFAYAQNAGQWVDRTTIFYNGKKYVDRNPGGKPYAFLQEGADAACEASNGVTRLVMTDDPYANDQPKTFNHVEVRTGPCSEVTSSVTVPHSDAKNKAPGTGTVPTTPGPTTPGTPGTPATEPVCSVGALTWVICPLIDLIADGTKMVASILDPLLRIDPLPIGNPEQNGIFRAWSSILNIANIVFVIGFLFIIFSQATSVGLSNYGIKRILPRIFAAAILMNISYYICAIMVDISNALGAGIYGLFFNALQAAQQQQVSNGGFGDSISGTVETVYKGLATIGIAAIILFMFLLPVLLAVLLIFFVLAARLAILMLLVMIAPLAFAAWLLPNTEKYFKKWWELFIQMLVLYPLVMVMFAGATVAASLITISANQNNNGGLTNEAVASVQGLIALIVQVLPLFALPFLFKTSSGLLGRIESMTRGGAKSAKGMYESTGFGQYRKQEAARRQRFVTTGNYNGRRPVAYARSRMNQRLNASNAFNAVTGNYGGYRRLDEARQRAEERDKATKMFSGDYKLAEVWAKTAGQASTAELTSKYGLNQGEVIRYQQMVQAGQHRRTDSVIAAMQVTAESGYGTNETLNSALGHIDRLSTDKNQAELDKSDLEDNFVRPTWKGKGRGDLLGDRDASGKLERDATGKLTKGAVKGWDKVNMGNFSKHAFNPDSNPKAAESEESFKQWLAYDDSRFVVGPNGEKGTDERLRKVMTKYDDMNDEAKGHVERVVNQYLNDPKNPRINTTGPNAGKTMNFEDLRAYYGLKNN